MSRLFLNTLLKHIVNVDTSYPKNPYNPVNLYPVELKNIPPGLSKKRIFMADIVGKLWGFCHTLRHDGIDYGDYIEQLTYG